MIAVLVSNVLEDYQYSKADNFQRNCDVNIELREVEIRVGSAFIVAAFGPEAVGLKEFSFC